jgi:two-component system, NtrC family, sensor kinase
MNAPARPEHLAADAPPLSIDLLAALPVPAALHQGGALRCANDALARLSGRSLPDLLALPYEQLVVPDDRDALQAACRQCLQGEVLPPAVSARLINVGGGERPVELHARPVRHDGRPAVLLTCIDQSDILHVQTSLFGLSELLRQIVDAAPVASMVIDAEHRVTHWNSACERLTGLARHQMIGRSESWRVFHAQPHPLPADRIVDGQAADTSALPGADGALPRPMDGGGLEVEGFFAGFGLAGAWLYLTAAPLHDAEGRVIGAVQTVQDVTERRRVQDELRHHRNTLERLVQQRSAELAATARALERFVRSAPIGVAYTVDGLFRRVNPAMAEMLGHAQEVMLGLMLADCHVDEAGAQRLAEMAAALAPGEPMHTEMWLRRADGQPIWVQIDAHAAEGEDAGRGLWWMMQDRTEIRSAQQQLQARFEELRETNRKLGEAQNQLLQQDKMASIGQLAAGVAHEINNPIGFVSSNLNTLRQYADALLALTAAFEAAGDAPADPAATAALARLRQETELDYLREDMPQLLDECAEGLARVKKIVQDLKDFSRVDQSDWQEADLNAGLESTLNVVRHEVKYKAEVVRRLQPLPAVTCLAGQLNQVFMNLFVNAAHAISGQGTITLSSGAEGDWVWVQVDDTGCGMTEDVRRRIFEPFFTTKDVGKGTGLGLSLSFSNVQKHGGAIHVRSTPGVGSSFRVWVPVGGPSSVPQGSAPTHWQDAEAGA